MIREGQSLDVIELDAASNNGVDDVRRIIELVQYECMSNMRIVILDECHMLSTGAFNALLKVLEEPPKKVMFILCTTEIHKVPATILSRCRKFQFKALTISEITAKLRDISEARKKDVEEGSLELIAKAAKGSMRDAESIFENFLGLKKITKEEVRSILGYSSEERILRILEAVADCTPCLIQDAIMESVDKGENLNRLIEDMLEILVNIVSIQLGGDLSSVPDSISDLCFKFQPQQIFDLINTIRKTYEARPDNLAVSLIAALVGQSYHEDRMAALMGEIEALRNNASLLQPESTSAKSVDEAVNVPSGSEIKEEACETTSSAPLLSGPEADWDSFMSAVDQEASGTGGFEKDESPEKKLANIIKITPDKPKASPVTADTEETSSLSNKARASLAAAGFVVEEDTDDDTYSIKDTKVHYNSLMEEFINAF